MTTLEAPKRQVGEMLRLWRERRHLSQLDLALLAEVSTRHLSFVETGRARPSSQMIVRLTEQLEVPLRERNQLLLAAGYAPLYSETGLDAPQMSSIRAAVRQVLTGHEPYPAVAFDRSWSMVDGNSAVQLFLDGVSPELLQPPVNILRVALHPDGMANSIINVGEWRAHLLGRLRRQIALTADPNSSSCLRNCVATRAISRSRTQTSSRRDAWWFRSDCVRTIIRNWCSSAR